MSKFKETLKKVSEDIDKLRVCANSMDHIIDNMESDIRALNVRVGSLSKALADSNKNKNQLVETLEELKSFFPYLVTPEEAQLN